MSFNAGQCRESRKETFVSLPSLAVRFLEASQVEDGVMGNCKTECQLSGYRGLYRLLGWRFSLTFKPSGRNPHSIFGGTSIPLPAKSQGTLKEFIHVIVTFCSNVLFTLRSWSNPKSRLLGLLHSLHCFVPCWRLPSFLQFLQAPPTWGCRCSSAWSHEEVAAQHRNNRQHCHANPSVIVTLGNSCWPYHPLGPSFLPSSQVPPSSLSRPFFPF